MLANRIVGVAFVLSATLAGLCRPPAPNVGESRLPAELDDGAFRAIVSDFSEPPGYFRSDNLVSNESAFQQVIPELILRTRPGGVYLGVGPEQNFTYVVALRPRLAFILDIRRQNLLLHLLYKALIELSPRRADFVSRLFSRPPPAGASPEWTVQQLFNAQAAVEPERGLYERNLKEVLEYLVDRKGLELSEHDKITIGSIYEAFYKEGPDLTYSFRTQYGSGGYGWRRFPTYGDLMTATDLNGTARSYLASEDGYACLRDLHLRNAIIPIVGDFAGARALRAVGAYLARHGATVTAFYTSNVEQYLFRGGRWQQFIDNVASLPLDENSLFIRSYFDYGSRYPSSYPLQSSSMLLSSIAGLVDAHGAGRIATYTDVIEMSRPPAATSVR